MITLASVLYTLIFIYIICNSPSGLFFTQDYAYRDIDGDYQIQGRKDDIIRVKGVWLQVPEIESNIVRILYISRLHNFMFRSSEKSYKICHCLCYTG